MKFTRTRILTIGAALILAAAAAIAQGPHGRGGPDGEFNHMLAFFTDKLDLSSAQQEQAKALWAKEKPTMQPLMQQERLNRQAMETLQSSAPFDETKTRALATQQAQTHIELEVEHARIKSEMMQILTADQKAKLASLKSEHQGRMKDAAPPEE
jgi:Spy/CpxP family protein refolding chaperone